jgi:DNA repair protein RecO (recombination protein O)
LNISEVTDALILKAIKYDDSSVIVHAYTRRFGLESYLARGVRKKGAKIRIALLQPMNLTQMTVVKNKKGRLHIIKELTLSPMYASIPFDLKKNAIIIFINEVLGKILKEETPHEELFDFLKEYLIELDHATNNYSNTHLFMLAQLTQYLGILPNFDRTGWFDMLEGVSVVNKPIHDYFIAHEERFLFETLFSTDQKEQKHLKFTNEQRAMLLNMLTAYYAIHIPGTDRLKSKEILHVVLQG